MYQNCQEFQCNPLKNLIGCDDSKLIKTIGNWEIELTLENNCIDGPNNPDWFGYKRIDTI